MSEIIPAGKTSIRFSLKYKPDWYTEDEDWIPLEVTVPFGYSLKDMVAEVADHYFHKLNGWEFDLLDPRPKRFRVMIEGDDFGTWEISMIPNPLFLAKRVSQ